MKATESKFSIAVFPFLKTSRAIKIGHLVFRSTDDIKALTPEQADAVSEIAQMLFLQDDLRIKSASYAMIPAATNANQVSADLEQLRNVQAVVAYIYAAPRHEFGDLFLPPENASLAIFSPEGVPSSLVRPKHHVTCVGPSQNQLPNDPPMVQGYEGSYNFRHPFWVAKGSRLYGPTPNIILNISQDLGHDFDRAQSERVDYQLLAKLLLEPSNQMSVRIFTALKWFNAANSNSNDGPAALVDLAIAFEALLSLPVTEKSDRLIDAISLLLGRTSRLDVWARQFYDARSQVVHEGSSTQLHFMASDSKKDDGRPYQSLLVYGRRVFQLCLGTILVGADLAAGAQLEETLITNQERFESICKVLDNGGTVSLEILGRIAPIVAAIDRNRYVPEPGLQLATMIGAVRLASKILADSGASIAPEIQEQLVQFKALKSTKDFLPSLEVLQKLNGAFLGATSDGWTYEADAVRSLVHIVWQYTARHYFWLKKGAASPSPPA